MAAKPSDVVGPRETLLDFLKNNFMYKEKTITQVKKAITTMKLGKFKKGEDILKQGDIGDTVMIVVKGVVELYHNDEGGNRILNRRLGAHEIFGEYSFVSSKHVLKRSVAAREDCVLLVLKREDFIAHRTAGFMSPIKARVEDAKKQLLRQSLKRLPFLNDVTDKELHDVDKYFKIEEAPARLTIFNQGDLGDKFYVLVAGTVVVTTRDDLGFVIEVARLSGVSSFGEQALITEEERNATITTLEDCQFYTLSKKEFGKFLGATPSAKESLDNSVAAHKVGNYFSDQVPIFQSMSKRHQHLLGVVASLVRIGPDEVIKAEGSNENTNFYLIVAGSCDVYVGEEYIKSLKAGEYFGEVALVSESPSSATVKSSSQPGGCTLMAVTKEDFLNIFTDEEAFISELKIRLDGESCQLADVLKHPRGRASFLNHCKQEYAKENVDFWQDVSMMENLKRRRVRKSVLVAMQVSVENVKQQKASLLAKRASKIFSKYLEENSPEQVNLPAHVRDALIKRYDENDLSWDMFEEARESIYELIEADNFQRYKMSEAFQELIGQIGTYKRGSVIPPPGEE